MPHKKGKTIFRILALSIAAGLVASVMNRLVIAKGESVNYTVFWEVGGPIKQGDYITFEYEHEYIKGGRRYGLTKRAGCMPGQFLELRGRYHYCDDQKLGFIRERGDSGVPLTPFQWHGPVPNGKIFTIGDHEKSFDSRYWGFVEIANSTRVVGLF